MIRKFLPALVLTFALAGCSSGDKKEEASTETVTTTSEAFVESDKITVQHILIGFNGSLPGKTIARTQEAAEKLAKDILARAKAGENFPELVQKYTDDAFPGIYAMTNSGVVADAGGQAIPRDRMVKGFGDASFALRVGEIGIANYSRPDSPYGWHIVKRID